MEKYFWNRRVLNVPFSLSVSGKNVCGGIHMYVFTHTHMKEQIWLNGNKTNLGRRRDRAICRTLAVF
jgi:mevalonate pyrophosphate decarboxylase